MKKLYIMCGVAFSGKSTLAKKVAEYKRAVLVSQDQIWFQKKKELHLDIDKDEDWDMVQQLSKEEVRQTLLNGHSVVYDDISLKYDNRESLREIAQECGAETVLIYLDTPRSVQQERQTKNAETKERHDVPEHIINWGLEELEIPQENEKAFVFKPETDIADWLSKLP
jgi:predicted kinase